MDGGPESQTNTWNFVQKISHFFKKMKCSKQPNKQNKLNFYFSLRVEYQTCAVGGWGPMFGTKSQKNVFFGHLPLNENDSALILDMIG